MNLLKNGKEKDDVKIGQIIEQTQIKLIQIKLNSLQKDKPNIREKWNQIKMNLFSKH